VVGTPVCHSLSLALSVAVSIVFRHDRSYMVRPHLTTTMTEQSADDPRVVAVHTAPEAGAPMEPREAVEAVADRGLRGDRYFRAAGTFSDSARDVARDVTFLEREALDAVERDYDVSVAPGDHRRNVTTEGVGLNRLVGRRFAVGDAVFEGVELCEPCSYLEELLDREGVREAMVHRGGIRARVVESGSFGPGDAVAEVGSAPDAARPRTID
jgi:hypothetical protein